MGPRRRPAGADHARHHRPLRPDLGGICAGYGTNPAQKASGTNPAQIGGTRCCGSSTPGWRRRCRTAGGRGTRTSASRVRGRWIAAAPTSSTGSSATRPTRPWWRPPAGSSSRRSPRSSSPTRRPARCGRCGRARHSPSTRPRGSCGRTSPCAAASTPSRCSARGAGTACRGSARHRCKPGDVLSAGARPGHTRRHRPGATPSFRANNRGPRARGSASRLVRRPTPDAC